MDRKNRVIALADIRDPIIKEVMQKRIDEITSYWSTQESSFLELNQYIDVQPWISTCMKCHEYIVVDQFLVAIDPGMNLTYCDGCKTKANKRHSGPHQRPRMETSSS